MSRPIPIRSLMDAHAALKAIVAAGTATVPFHLWEPAMKAASRLEWALTDAGVTVAVAVPVEEKAREVVA